MKRRSAPGKLDEKFRNFARVSSKIRCFSVEAEHRASEGLCDDMLLMVNDRDFSDLEFVCSDRRRVAASRITLAGRSTVLESLIDDRGKLNEVDMPEVSSPVLISVFEFLYTGRLSDSRPESWRMACELIKASRFFLLPDLEAMTRRLMMSHVSIYTDTSPAASLLTEALEFKGLFDLNDDNLRVLVILLSARWSQSPHCKNLDYVKNLSEAAFHFLLATSKGSCDDVFRDLLACTEASCQDNDELLIEEYLRFRQVIRWWVYQSEHRSGDVDEILNYVTADEKRALSMSKNPNVVEEIPERPAEVTARLSKVWRGLQGHEESRKAVIRLLSNIEFRRIQPVLLTTVVEPMKIVPSAELLSAFRFHAMRRPLVLQYIRECGWKHGEAYCTLQGGYSICKSRKKTGLAVMGAAVTSSLNATPPVEALGGSDLECWNFSVYEWHFIVEEIPGFCCELGFIDSRELEAEKTSFDTQKLSEKVLSWAVNLTLKPSERGKAPQWMMSRKNGGISLDDENASAYEGLVQVQKGLRAVFSFDACANTCSVQVDDGGKIQWDHIPVAKYHPAASFGKSSAGRVRIELASGFDVLKALSPGSF